MNDTGALHASIVLLSLALAVWTGRRWMRQEPDTTVENAPGRHRWLILIAPVLAISLVGGVVLGRFPRITWSFPVWLEYAYAPVLRIVAAASVGFMGGLLATIAIKTRHPQSRRLLVGCGALIVSLEVAQSLTGRPLAADLVHREMDGVILQTTGASCAAAAAANLVRAWGLAKSERDMAALFGTTELGTSSAQIIYGMRRLGVTCERLEIENRDTSRLPGATILFVATLGLGPESHAVLFLGTENGRLKIVDPLSGSSLYEDARLRQIWSGRGVSCRP